MPDPMWRWCAMPGASRDTKLQVDVNAYGDGYTHRSTRGLNPARPSWSLQFPFQSASELNDMDSFLRDHAVGGFYFTPPDGGGAVVFVTVDSWAASVPSRHGQRTPEQIVGTLTATFDQSFNPQPISPIVLASGQRNVLAPPLNEIATGMRAALRAVLVDIPAPLPVVDGVIQPSPTTPLPSIPVQPPAEPTDA